MKKVLKKALGVLLVILGFLALITPATPGSWLALIGLELLGLRVLFEDKFLFFLSDKQKKKLRSLFRKRGRAEQAEDSKGGPQESKQARDDTKRESS
jgi:hypothetical protein